MLWAFRALGAALAILGMEALAALADEPLSRVPFVTSIVLVFAMPGAPAARARAVVGGHVLSAATGWVCLACLGPGDASAAAAVGAATLVMLATRTLHPPAGLDAFLVVTQAMPATWIVVPLVGACVLAASGRAWASLAALVFGDLARPDAPALHERGPAHEPAAYRSAHPPP